MPHRLTISILFLALSTTAFGQDACQTLNSDASAAPQINLDTLSLPEYYRHWNWVPNDMLPSDARCQTSPGCEGRFIEPARDWIGADQDPATAPLNVASDTIESVGDQATMTGDVQLRKGNLSLDAGYAQYRRSDSTVLLRDNVTLRQPGVMMRGQFALIDTNRGLGELEQAEILSYDSGARGAAGRIARSDFGRFELSDASYTQCTPDNETWSLHAKEIELDFESGRGVAKGTSIRVYDIPVFYTPYLNFPVDDRRATGFLFPTFGLANNQLDISTPYYLNLAPNYDLILTPRFIEERGEALESEFRYLNGISEWGIKTSYLPEDQQKGEDRWLLDIQEKGFFSDSWSSEVDYTRVSDEDYFDDLGLANLEVKRSTHLNQQAQLSFLNNSWAARVEVQRYQTIAAVEDPYRKLPQIGLQYRAPARNFQLEPSMELEYTYFDHNDSVEDGGNQITGQRLYGTVGASFPMRWRWGFIKPSLESRNVAYELVDADLVGAEENPNASSTQGSIDAGLFFERPLTVAGSDLTQTLEPRLFYRYAEFTDQSDQPDFDTAALTFTYQQLFRSSRFTGHDRLDDADQLTVGVTSRFIEHGAGREFLTLSVGQLYYFSDGEVQLPGDPIRDASNSDIATQVRLLPSERQSFSIDMLMDARQGVINQSNLSYHQRGDSGALLNVAYTFRREGNQFGGLEDDVMQAEASVSVPVNNQWKLFAKTHYDFEDNRPVENLVGAEYQNCCWLTRVVYQRALEPDDNNLSNNTVAGNSGTEVNSAVLVEFQLKGLGGLGTAVTSVLKESIFGYQADE